MATSTSWPERATKALVHLFRRTQDVEVYVEDRGDEVFYRELFKRHAPAGVRISRVFGLGGRQEVLALASAYDFNAGRALFIIDGDLDWVRGTQPPRLQGVYRLDAYCIENLLISKEALVQIVIEEAAISPEDAEARLQFDKWSATIESMLLDLFTIFAVAHELCPTLPTVGGGIGQVITNRSGRAELDASKISALGADIKAKVITLSSNDAFASATKRVEARIAGLARRIDVVSGKAFLFPLLYFHLPACISKPLPSRKSLRLRLARHSSYKRCANITTAIKAAARR